MLYPQKQQTTVHIRNGENQDLQYDYTKEVDSNVHDVLEDNIQKVVRNVHATEIINEESFNNVVVDISTTSNIADNSNIRNTDINNLPLNW